MFCRRDNGGARGGAETSEPDQKPQSVKRQEADLNGSVFGDAAGYEAWFGTTIGSFVDELERPALRRILADTPRGAIVGSNAGTGHFARALAHRFEIIAVDPSPAM